MSQDTRPDHISKKRVVYTIAGVDAVRIRRDLEYRVTEAGPLTMDLYYPPDSTSGVRTPAVIFVTGFPDAGAEKMLGCKLKEMASYASWCQSVAVSGMVAITYTNMEPATDVHAVIQHIRQNAAALEIDANRVGVWSCSGNVPNALSVLMQGAQEYLRCAVLCYPYMLDLDGSTRVADAARQFGFVNPSAGRTLHDLRHDLPMFIARAGQDQMPGLNETLDRFVVNALSRNLPVTVVNHSVAPHAFDLFHDSDMSRDIIRRILTFLQLHLLV